MFCSAAVAWTTETSDDKWRSGWGQGVSEAEVTQGSGNKIYVACEDGSGGDSSVSFELVGDGPKSGSEVLLIFDKGKPESISVDKLGRIVSDSYASASSFEYVIAKLKKHLSVYVRYPDGREATFTLKGAAAAIGQCRSTWP
jgi:hypothetical protein